MSQPKSARSIGSVWTSSSHTWMPVTGELALDEGVEYEVTYFVQSDAGADVRVTYGGERAGLYVQGATGKSLVMEARCPEGMGGVKISLAFLRALPRLQGDGP